MGGAITANHQCLVTIVLNDQLMSSSPPASTHIRPIQASAPTSPVFSAAPTAGPASSRFPAAAGSPPAASPAWPPTLVTPRRLYAAVKTAELRVFFAATTKADAWTQCHPGQQRHRATPRGTMPAQRGGRRAIPLYGPDQRRRDPGAPSLQSVWRSLDQGATWPKYGGSGPRPRPGTARVRLQTVPLSASIPSGPGEH